MHFNLVLQLNTFNCMAIYIFDSIVRNLFNRLPLCAGQRSIGLYCDFVRDTFLIWQLPLATVAANCDLLTILLPCGYGDYLEIHLNCV